MNDVMLSKPGDCRLVWRGNEKLEVSDVHAKEEESVSEFPLSWH
jgi:hypothetical protein